jgi:hypothetical protein
MNRFRIGVPLHMPGTTPASMVYLWSSENS